MEKTILERTVERVSAAIGRFIEASALRSEMAALSDADRREVLRDVGIEETDLDKIIAGHKGPDALLPQRLAEAGIDADAIRAKFGGTMRDLQRVCSLCGEQKRCNHDLSKLEFEKVEGYCPNSFTVDALAAKILIPGDKT